MQGQGKRPQTNAASQPPSVARQGSSEGDDFVVRAPSISLPKGGGAITGIGEKFAANPVTGTGSLTVPIAVSPGRSGFGPGLSLSYDSGSGNGPFGFGWRLSLPSIARKTDKGLPLYADGRESDVFILSGAEDLVPVYRQDPDGTWVANHPGYRRDTAEFWVRDSSGRLVIYEDELDGYRVRRYRPRIEGLFARIERWSKLGAPGDVHWRSISKDNILTLYGPDADSRIADPLDPSRIFTWLICETRDDKGNAVLYRYKAEDGLKVELSKAHERNRGPQNDARRTANRYLKRIHYGNRTPLLDNAGHRPRFLDNAHIDTQIANSGWMFEVVFDYGEHDGAAPKPNDAGAWAYRPDPFSSYRSGFEVRTTRLCRRVLMFHHFPGEAGVERDSLVRSTDFTYSDEVDPTDVRNPVYTFLRAVTQTGYRRHNGGYLKRSLPPVEYEYTQPVVQDTVQDVDAASLENLPIGVDGASYQWTDLHGEGIPGVLTEQANAWFYKRNLSPISERSVEFAPLERVAAKPNLALAGGAQFMDLAGDGQPDLVVLDGPMPGFYEHDGDEGWHPFRPFTSRLNRDMRDPNLKFVDLNGDGHADVLISEDNAFVWHASLAEEGFGTAHRVAQALDEEKGPRLAFADGTQSIYLADLSGDGLTDLVRIRNGEICYWPNLGYGRFGAKVTMDHAPHFDHSDQFDHKRMRLADIDGTGTTDIIYLHRDGVRLYFNQSGNGWSEPRVLSVFPRVDDLVSIVPTDLLGNGTACLVWSSPLPADTRRPMRYVNLMGGQKPHLLVKTVNNLGAETRVQYAPSTKFYLQDKRDGKPWITRLPFPVHVVERVETYDHISGNRFVTRYAYHHGYFDGKEREFRGFGMVEQWDTEEFAALTGDGTLPAATNVDTASHVPPVLTKTWFHTGVYLGRDHVSDYFAGLFDAHDTGEYYREPGLTDAQARQRLLLDTVLPDGLTLAEEREACRALKGQMLRREIYALDGTDRARNPYSVLEQNFTVRQLQPRHKNRHGVFFSHEREALDHHYERTAADPLIGHSLTLEVDLYGNVLRQVAVAYGRRNASANPVLTDGDKAKQTQLHVVYTENSVTNGVSVGDHYRVPLPAQTQTYEVTGIKPENGERFSLSEWSRDGFALTKTPTEIPYEQVADPNVAQRRLVEHIRMLYRRDDLVGLLSLGQVGNLALPGESYKLALTPSLVARAFERVEAGQPPEALLPDPGAVLVGGSGEQGGYATLDGNWWTASGLSFYDANANVGSPVSTAALELSTARQHFFQPRKIVDPFGQSTVIEYDEADLFVTRTSDAVGNSVAGTHDYRVLQPRLVADANRNRSAAAFDALGLVVAIALMGKEGEPLGDELDGFDPDPSLGDLRNFIADPTLRAPALLGNASARFVYDLGRYQRAGEAPFASALSREAHFHVAGGDQSRVQVRFSYSDGFGRVIQNKMQAEPGDAPKRGTAVELLEGDIQPGELVRDAQGELVMAHATKRWVGSGRTVFNNKGQPVRQYEPFFSATHLYESETEMTDTGVSSVLFYDPVERLIATLHPNHTYEKVVFDVWHQQTFDVNDTVAASGVQTGDPRTDPDIAGYVREYFKTQPGTWQTWHAQRIGNQMGAAERDAAQKAGAHADTPTVTHMDALGRPFLTVADNGPDPAQPGERLLFASRVELDIEGNDREVSDSLGRTLMRYDYDLLGNRIHQANMDAGERWIVNDVAGNPIRTWDSRGFLCRMTYDQIRRPRDVFVSEEGGERLARRTVYGESEGDTDNHRGRVYQMFDEAGILTFVRYDFKGNQLESRRDLLPSYIEGVDWSQNPAVSGEQFVVSRIFDALNRSKTVTSPDGSVYRPSFNEADLLEKVDVDLRGGAATHFVTDIDYDARGQRERIVYGNGAVTRYQYDRETYRLNRMTTTRPPGGTSFATQLFNSSSVVQDLHYTYDPIGNLTRVRDEALKTVMHDGQEVKGEAEHTYDPLYRLIETKGREHIAQTDLDFNGKPQDAPFAGPGPHPHDMQALRTYAERFKYDAVGNFETLRHTASGGNWTRDYDYDEESLLDVGQANNRLTRTIVGNGINHVENYGHDAHGNMTSTPKLTEMRWDFEDQLHEVNLGGGGKAYYVYDAYGRRVRKVLESQNGTLQRERLYLDGFEVYREYGTNGVIDLERETLQVLDDEQRIALAETQTILNGNAVGAPTSLLRYQLANHVGSSSVELDDQAKLVTYEEYHSFGSTSLRVARSQAEAAKRYRYVGKERDDESGLYYYGGRYYACWLGRWCSADPATVDVPGKRRPASDSGLEEGDEPAPPEGPPEEPTDSGLLSHEEQDARASNSEGPDESQLEPAEEQEDPAVEELPASPYIQAANNPMVNVDPDGNSPVSVVLKQAAKVGLKRALKQYIKKQIKGKLKQYAKKKWAKQFLKDAIDIVDTLDSAWWEIGLELIPIAGDIYGAASFGVKGKKVWKRLRALEKRVDKAVAAKKKPVWKGPTDYGHIPSPKNLTKTKPTPRQVREMKKANRKHNDGVLRDDVTGENMVDSKKSMKGVTPAPNEAQVDHIKSIEKRGTRAQKNLQLRTRKNNRDKWHH